MIRVTIPYQRQCFSPAMAAYLQAIERVMVSAQTEDTLLQASHDLLAFGTCRLPKK